MSDDPPVKYPVTCKVPNITDEKMAGCLRGPFGITIIRVVLIIIIMAHDSCRNKLL